MMLVKASGAAPYDGGHPARARVDSFHRIHIEVGKGGTAHLGVADVGAIQGESSFDATLTVDGELSGKVGGAIGVGHGARSQQEEGCRNRGH